MDKVSIAGCVLIATCHVSCTSDHSVDTGRSKTPEAGTAADKSSSSSPCRWRVGARELGPALDEVQFFDSFMAFGIDDQCVWSTDNGGQSWAQRYCHSTPDGRTERIHHLLMVTTKTGWMVGGGDLLHTSDGGRRWERKSLPGIVIRSVRFLNHDMGWLAGERSRDAPPYIQGVVYKTRNGGQTWTQSKLGITETSEWRLSNIWPISADVIWVVGDFLLYTKDSGQQWKKASLEAEVLLRLRNVSLQFRGENTGWIQRMPPNDYLVTDDGGATWVVRKLPHASRGQLIHVLPDLAWRVDGDIWRSEGDGWELELAVFDKGNGYTRLQYIESEKTIVAIGSKLIASCQLHL